MSAAAPGRPETARYRNCSPQTGQSGCGLEGQRNGAEIAWLQACATVGWSLANSIQFGYALVGTDLLAHKGAAATVPFPMFIALMACVQISLARFAAKRCWVN
jgi:hypothetical protein